MGLDDFRSTGLVLGLGFSSSPEKSQNKPPPAARVFEPSLTLGLCAGTYQQNQGSKGSELNKGNVIDASDLLYRQDSGASSFSNASVKREREHGSEDGETERVSPRVSDEDDDGTNARKKLRLNKDQSALLEESFKQHSTLNPKQKLELARKLNLRPRQVEVWFQNRRARTKLKQTEVDCEFLKKCCETLTDENRRLQKELQELKALKLAQPFYMQLPAATLTMCPSCERIGGAGGSNTAGDNGSKFAMTQKPHFFNPFTNPSAAC
ncbi:unnamed protein product [Thlaspi arvense]|uniref:Homeobox domain-containing protein n=1 Tax=Thlaspi arvense TaxID=13288 RepID=A0AAU9T607_THLAR|nr:unnamed protein product [Thlaspi arvense]